MDWSEYPKKMLEVRAFAEAAGISEEVGKMSLPDSEAEAIETALEAARRLLSWALFHLKRGEKVPEKITGSNVWWASELEVTVEQIEEWLEKHK